MFEREAHGPRLSIRDLPADAAARFAELRPHIAKRSLIPWAEHCSECAMPSCFTTCEFYTPRADFKCRRFADGIQGVPSPDAATPEIMKIRFRNWGKLEGKGSVTLQDLAAADASEAKDRTNADRLRGVMMPAEVRRWAIAKRYDAKNIAAAAPAPADAATPEALVLECYNSGAQRVTATVTLRPTGEASRQPYQYRWEIAPGFNRDVIAFNDIARIMDPRQPFLAQIEPADGQARAPLYFGLVDFVTTTQGLEALRAIATGPRAAAPALEPAIAAASAAPAAPVATSGPLKKLKCIVWDLDNTLWAGTLVEDGPETLVLNEEFAALIKSLDERGVLHSIASKNDPERALAALRQFGLEEYFLHPQISWNPKSLALQTIIQRLNIGADTFIFVDDQPFERAEVGEANPAVRVVDPADLIATIPQDVLTKEPTAESRARRQMYREETVRHDAMTDFSGDYEAFLRGCGLRLEIAPLGPKNIRRVHELAQRTNQMNFSGNRYTQPDLNAIMTDANQQAFVLRCSDRFGDYGIIGFGIVDVSERLLQDLMFSCRIQSKRVEHAFIAHLLERHHMVDGRPFTVFYRPTDRNAPSARFFDDMGFIVARDDGATRILAYPEAEPAPEETIVTIITPDDAPREPHDVAAAASL